MQYRSMKMTYEAIRDNEEVKAYIEKGNEKLTAIGFTDHSVKHCALVAERAGDILTALGYDEHEIESLRSQLLPKTNKPS